jgi:hypothetical protein
MFPHYNIHKYTWTYPEGKICNRIDHILIEDDIQVYFFNLSEGLIMIPLFGSCRSYRETGSEQMSYKEDRYGEIQSQEFKQGMLKNNIRLHSETSLQL